MAESRATQQVIAKLGLQKHPEGGYFVETDRDGRRVPNPFLPAARVLADTHADATRAASTSIYYLLTPAQATGVFHRNKGRTMHTLHRGRGRYVIVHADEQRDGGKVRVESFVVGPDVLGGERLQWMVEGGKYKASFLLPDHDGASASDGLLISEVREAPPGERARRADAGQTVVPGFEFADHDFMSGQTLHELVTAPQEDELRWLIRRDAAQ